MGESKTFAMFLLHVSMLWCFLFYLILLSLSPTQPNYTIVSFHISTHPNHINTTTSRVNHGGHNVRLSFALEIQNPNQQYGVHHTNTLLKFYYGEYTLGEITVHRFHQKRGRTSQKLIHHVRAHARTKLLKAAMSNSTVELKVSLVTRIRYELWGWTINHHQLTLQGQLPIGSDGKISGKKKIKLYPREI
ncbi:hypothetical protein CsSME_00030764 [Camellia sinensis var. sinensis]